VGSNPQP
jgi:hypothetical protein